ncbi:hypothetical protein ACRE_015190 [Hapsidospora chrysogenum ATCC 11550]|uniref:Zn(2)-C6 fungal-type domain-containing protein n=1 Tax=Hapsidospora chrysogenum (strain ATCC 11550 / CBS 779.69 / DSM 880 / IAM 14645 / JCM 23072 / IMI 49137) TaxID=857340 RepID=A0A086TE56_HAPC1|nr:hypothetical protein ACRE_015190 [Hapsidospora chrysogenum ATCC 11550]
MTTSRSGAPDPAETGADARKPAKAKRAQVRRACDACRLARAKCDLTRPCRNCKQAGRECVSKGLSEFKGIASATREVERLRQRIQELEAEKGPSSPPGPLNTPPDSESPPQESQPSCQTQPSATGGAVTPWKWKSANIDGLLYGPISLQFFTRRLSTYLDLDVGPPPPPAAVLSAHSVDLSGCEVLDRHRQDYFMDLFSSSYGIAFPVTDERDLQQLYVSLWDAEGLTRRADPLVDIVLALSIQYAFNIMGQADPLSTGEQAEMAVAGSPFYHRCQDALDPLMEAPSVKAVQCIFLSAMYLSHTRCYNAALATLRRASHIASTIAVETESQRQLLVRIRRCMRTLDIRLCVKLGRFTPNPIYSCHHHQDEESDHAAPPDPGSEPDWSLFHRQLYRLCELTEDVYKTFLDRSSRIFPTGDDVDFYTQPSTRDECARIMLSQLGKLHAWAAQVPPPLRPTHLSGGASSSACNLEDQPVWLQRQRLTLECQYHDFCVSLLGIFIHFPPAAAAAPRDHTSSASRITATCAHHAVALTALISRAATETDLFRGCYLAFEWQQNAAYALAGFAAAYPSSSARARRALFAARAVFDSFGAGNRAARAMSSLTAELDARISDIAAVRKTGRREGGRGGGGGGGGDVGSGSLTPLSGNHTTSSARDSVVVPTPVSCDAGNPHLVGAQTCPEPNRDLAALAGSLWDPVMDFGSLWEMDSGGLHGDAWGSWTTN